jgi:hypothetical protein
MSPKVCRTAISKLLCLLLTLAVCSAPIFATFALDEMFGPGGRVTISFPDATTSFSSNGLRIFVQPSGRILAAGGFTNNGPDGQFPGIAWVGLTFRTRRRRGRMGPARTANIG